MKKNIVFLFVAALLCGGCQSLKRALNEEPKKKTAAKPAAVRNAEPEVFPGSSRHSRRPSLVEGELTAQEREMLNASLRDSRLPSHDLRQEDKRDNKAASDWVFGR